MHLVNKLIAESQVTKITFYLMK